MPKVGRNDPCPCGSGKKYKHCCLRKEPRVVETFTEPTWSGPPLLRAPDWSADHARGSGFDARGIDEVEILGDEREEELPATPQERALDLVEEAWGAADPAERIRLARQALAEWPDSVDAYAILGDASTRPEEAVEHYREALAAADRAIGAKWWDHHPKREWVEPDEVGPALEVRRSLGLALMELGHAAEASEHFRFLLRYDPEDYEGARFDLLNALLYADRDDEALELIRQFADPPSAHWLFAKALLKYRRDGDGLWSRRALVDAFGFAPMTASYLLEPVSIPESLDLLTLDVDAIEAARELAEFWQRTPGALDWLRTTYEAGPDAKVEAVPGGDGPVLSLTYSDAVGYIRCPRCDRKTKPRKRDVAVLLEPDETVVVRVGCRQCESCDTLGILNRDLQREVESAFRRRGASLAGRDYVPLGIIDAPEGERRPDGPADERWVGDHLRRWKDEIPPAPAPDVAALLNDVEGEGGPPDQIEPKGVIEVPFSTR